MQDDLIKNFLKHIILGYWPGDKGYVEVKGIAHNYTLLELACNAPLIWPIGRLTTFLFFWLPLICFFSLIAKLSGEHLVKHVDEQKGEYYTFEK